MFRAKFKHDLSLFSMANSIAKKQVFDIEVYILYLYVRSIYSTSVRIQLKSCTLLARRIKLLMDFSCFRSEKEQKNESFAILGLSFLKQQGDSSFLWSRIAGSGT